MSQKGCPAVKILFSSSQRRPFNPLLYKVADSGRHKLEEEGFLEEEGYIEQDVHEIFEIDFYDENMVKRRK